MPGGFAPPVVNEDGTITLPDGTVLEPGKIPQRPGGPGGNGPGGPEFGQHGMGEQETERTDLFTIRDGGNLFSGVSTKE